MPDPSIPVTINFIRIVTPQTSEPKEAEVQVVIDGKVLAWINMNRAELLNLAKIATDASSRLAWSQRVDGTDTVPIRKEEP